jgi:hypothetical protein
MLRKLHLFNLADKGRMSSLFNYLSHIVLPKHRVRHPFVILILTLNLTHKPDHNLLLRNISNQLT